MKNPSEAYRNQTYVSDEDSELLRKVSKGFAGLRCLEIGIGYGSNISEMRNRFSEAVGTDVRKTDGFAARGVELVVSDSGTCFRKGLFDLVLLNPPYVPSEEIVDPTVDGGQDGLEIAERFLKESADLIAPHGRILIVLSSLNPLKRFQEFCKSLSLQSELAASQELFFESIYVFELSREES